MHLEFVTLRGFAAPFDTEIELRPGMREAFAPGAFDFSGASNISLLLGSHDDDPVATTVRDSLRFFQNRHGLAFEAEAPVTQDLLAWLPAMRADALGVSVSFRGDVLAGEWDADEDEAGILHLRHTACRIDHIAVAVSPAYRDTSVWLADWEDDHRLSARQKTEMQAWHRGPDAALKPASPPEPRRGAAPPAAYRGSVMMRGNAPHTPAAKRHPRHPDAIWDSTAGLWRRPSSAAIPHRRSGGAVIGATR